MTKVFRFGLLAAFAGLLLYVMYGVFFQPQPVKLGETVTQLKGVDLEGHPVALNDFKGKTVVVNFFTTWCDPCKQEAPDLAKFAASAAQNQVVLLMIDRKEPQSLVKQFAETYHLTNPILLDQEDRLAQPFGITGQPETFFIDSNGVLRFHQLGPLTADELTDFVQQTKQKAGEKI